MEFMYVYTDHTIRYTFVDARKPANGRADTAEDDSRWRPVEAGTELSMGRESFNSAGAVVVAVVLESDPIKSRVGRSRVWRILRVSTNALLRGTSDNAFSRSANDPSVLITSSMLGRPSGF